ncbi:MAG: PilZ domain-containing protein [Desulfomonilaceae bacterium]|nr:PilZ domain-containing protein [Desulfomonilaceae bacterium]
MPRKINANRLVAEIRSRASDFELMEKYGLSFVLLQRVLEKLVHRCALRPEELMERGAYFDDPKNRVQTRREPRTYLRIPLRVEVIGDSSASGVIIDLSERGFRTRGLEIGAFDKKLFAMRTGKEPIPSMFQLEAVCRWTRIDLAEVMLSEAGFEIVKVSERDFREMLQIMERLGAGDRNVMRPKTDSHGHDK